MVLLPLCRAAEEQELSETLADIQAGRHIDGWALLEEIKAKSRA